MAEQSMDLRQGGEDAEGEDKQAPVMNLDLFTADRHAMIVKYKTAFYTFYLPVALGMVVSGMDDDASYEAVQQICVHMGEYFQVRRGGLCRPVDGPSFDLLMTVTTYSKTKRGVEVECRLNQRSARG